MKKLDEEQDYGFGGETGYFQPKQDVRVHEVILNNDFIIDELMRTLRGEIIDSNTNQLIKVGQPLVSEDAINWIVGRMLPYTSKIVSLSVLDEWSVRQIIFEFEAELSAELAFPEGLGVERKNRDYVKWLMVHLLVATAWKSRQGETLKKLLEQHHVSETNIKQEEAKKGLFGGLKL